MNLRFIPTSVHGVIDHVVGPALFAAPSVLGLKALSTEGLIARAVGGAQAVYSNFTDYETSKRKVLSMRTHLALDAASGATLALVPVLTGARKRGVKHWLPHLAIGAFEIGMAAMTKTEPASKKKPKQSARIAKLVATAKLAKKTTKRATKVAS